MSMSQSHKRIGEMHHYDRKKYHFLFILSYLQYHFTMTILPIEKYYGFGSIYFAAAIFASSFKFPDIKFL